MNCKKVISMLSSYQDGELHTALEQEVKIHLQECPSCRKEWNGLEQLVFRLRRVRLPDDPYLPARVMAALPVQPARNARLLPALAYSLVFIVIFFTAFWLEISTNGISTKDSPPPATINTVLPDPQELGLLSVHNDTLNLFQERDHEQK